MLSVSPCVDFVLLPPEAQPTSEEQPRGLHTDVVGISGHGLQGTLSIQQDGALPSLITRFALDQRCTGCWTVRAPERRKRSSKRKRDDTNDTAPPQFDTDLFIASQADTTHLHVLEAITQVEAGASYLRADVQSLLVANVCGWLGVVQVWSDGLRLVWRGERTVDRALSELRQQRDEMKDEAEEQKQELVSIVRARLCDPYVALGLSDGSLQLLRVEEVEKKEERSDQTDPFTITAMPVSLHSLPSAQPATASSVAVTAFAIYKHSGHDGLFDASSRQRARQVEEKEVGVKQEDGVAAMEEESKEAPAVAEAEEEEDVDDLDLLLAGGGKKEASGTKQESSKDEQKEARTEVAPPAREQFVCVVCRSHYLELYALPSFDLLFRCPRFAAARQTLVDAVDESSSTASHAVLDDNLLAVTDVVIHRFSEHDSSPPVLLAFTAHNDLLVYQAYSYQPFAASSAPALRFTRLNHGAITRPLSSNKANRPQQSSAAAAGGWLYGERFTAYASLSGHSCLLMAGHRPLLLFSHRDRLQLHDLLLDRGADRGENEGEVEADEEAVSEDSEQRLRRLHNGVACATTFHNAQCQHGAVYVDIAGYVHIAELPPPPPLPSLASTATSTAVTLVSPDNPSYTHFDHDFPVRIHPLASTPRFMSYHPPTLSFAVVLSRPTPIQSIEEVTPRSLTWTEETYELLLLSSPATAAASGAQPFGVIGRFDDFEAHEVVLCMATVALGSKTYVAVGTGIQQGEETAVKGRILLLEPYSATSSSTAAPLLKLRVFVQTEKGPVTALSSLSSLLVAGIGMRVMLYEYDGKALVGRGFLDVEHDIVSVRVLKYYMLLADVYASVVLACWDPVCKQVILLGRWREAGELTAVEWLVEGKQLSAVVAELSGAVSVLRWTPRSLPPPPPLPRDINNNTSLSLTDFFAGVHSQRMAVKGELHTGSGVTRMEKYRMRERGRKHSSTGMAQPALGRAKSGSVGVSGAVSVPLLPEVDMVGRPHEQDRQPFNTATATPSLQSPPSLPPTPPSIRSALLLSSLHGSLSVMHTLDDLQYRRLHSLASQVHAHVPMAAALSARQWGSVQRRSGRGGGPSRRGVVDGALLRVWLGLDVDQQLVLCRMIGMAVEQVYDILLLNEHNAQLHV
ncbi:Cleavage and polyadenylation specificity factor subunit 1 [Xylographa carneopallida]|nr:Cleavage and polyadenylation specificity factor subunit 1 [Xylographa carneopallida]